MILRQLLALVDLRIKLSRNQQVKAGSFNFYVSRFLFLLAWVASVSSFLATAFGGIYFFRVFSVEVCNSAWGVAAIVFLFYWTVMVFGQIQQTETIPLEKIQHLPLSLKGAFFLNFLSSFANSATWLGAPVLFGIALGVVFARGPAMLHLLAATIGLFLFVAALTFQIRSWVARLMRNQRNKSFAMMIVPCLMIIIFCLATLDMGEFRVVDGLKDWTRRSFRAGPKIGFIMGMFVVAFASLYLSYRSVVRQYYGYSGRASSERQAKNENARPVSAAMFWRLPFVSVEASAVALGTLKNLVRSSELIAAVIPLALLLIFGAPYLLGLEGYNFSAPVLPWIPIGILAVVMLSFPAFLFSTFSYDRDGFRAFVLSPVSRRDLLLGKNLAVGFLACLSGWVVLVIAQFGFRYSTGAFLGSLLQVLVALLLTCVIGNLLSVYCPVGLKRGSMQPANAPVFTTILLYVGVCLTPVAVILPATTVTLLALAAKGSLIEMEPWLHLLLSFVQLIFAVPVYLFSLQFCGDRLWERESKIVNTVANLPE